MNLILALVELYIKCLVRTYTPGTHAAAAAAASAVFLCPGAAEPGFVIFSTRHLAGRWSLWTRWGGSAPSTS